MTGQTVQADVLIAGRGIAGLSLSVLLVRQGVDHILLARREAQRGLALAETLPPSVLPLLAQLGLRELFETCSQRTYGYHSLWGTPEVVDRHFFFQGPYPYGLKVDKELLLDELEKQAGEVIECQHGFRYDAASTSIRTTCEGKPITLRASYLVDATGRSRALLKQLGVGEIADGQQLALSCHLPRVQHPHVRHGVLTEAFAGGWGIVSALDETTNVMSLFGPRAQFHQHGLRDYCNWAQALTGTRLLREFLVPGVCPRVVGAQANCSRAARIAGPNWLALGDAAAAFDPLSSHGISNAVWCAGQAAVAMAAALGQPSEAPFRIYAERLAQIYRAMLAQREQLYRHLSDTLEP